ncbi:MAG: solute:sodium symporter family transporter [Butyricicoccus sp.]
MLWTLITFIFFTIMVAVISYVKTKGDDQTTTEGYFLAGRGLPGFVIAGSLLLTNLSAEQLVGSNGQTWSIGMSPLAFEVVAAVGLLALALFGAPRYLKSGITTIPELIGIRYDRTSKLWFSIAYIFMYLVIQIPVILYSGSLVFENIFGVSSLLGLTKFQAVVVLCIIISLIGSIYAIFGGLKAVAVSDTVNGIGLLIGGLMIPFLAFHVLGDISSGGIIDGVKYLAATYPEKLNCIAPADALPPSVPWPTVITGLIFLEFQAWCTHQSFIQRVLAAENLKEAQKGALYCAFLKIIGFMYLCLPGVIAYAIFEIQGDQVTLMDEAYPQLISQVVPAPIMGFFAAVMFGAILSSFNSVLNSINTMFTMDIYKEFINKEASQEKLVKVGKYAGIVFAVLTTIVGPMVYFFPAGLKTFLDSLVSLIGMPVMVVVFGGFIFHYLPKNSARIVMIFHYITYGFYMIVLSNTFHYLYAVAVLCAIEFIYLYIVNTMNKNRGAERWDQVDVKAVDLTPWKYRYVAAVIIIICILAVYFVFSPLVLGA